jgi:hypothetical protein
VENIEQRKIGRQEQRVKVSYELVKDRNKNVLSLQFLGSNAIITFRPDLIIFCPAVLNFRLSDRWTALHSDMQQATADAILHAF